MMITPVEEHQPVATRTLASVETDHATDNDDIIDIGEFIPIPPSTCFDDQHTPALSDQAKPQDKDKDTDMDMDNSSELTARLIFLNKDGGMLIGKDGRHINMLKESTQANWSITRTTAEQEDRIVIISGSIDDVVNAVYSLAKHIDKQQQQQQSADRLKDIISQPTVLRFLFPFKSIGAIIGTGGSHASRLRSESGITRFHVFESLIPFTQERIVEIGGSASAIKAATMLMLKSTESVLRQMQETSTLYRPVKNGLLQMIARDSGCKGDVFIETIDMARTGPKHTHAKRPTADSGERDRKRSRSLFGTNNSDHDRTSTMRTSLDSKKPRRMSDNSDYRRVSGHGQYSLCISGSSPRSQRYNSHKILHSRDPDSSRPRHGEGNNSSDRQPSGQAENKLVIADSIAGRLIGRNGCYLISLQDRSGASITLSPRIQGMSDRIVTIIGSHDQVNKACRLVKTSMRDFEQAKRNP
ncbi:PAB1 binding protein [Coemansia sp. RSA 1933]|nr:PAB1 binding protein [Coemansia sp. RSA 1933]